MDTFVKSDRTYGTAGSGECDAVWLHEERACVREDGHDGYHQHPNGQEWRVGPKKLSPALQTLVDLARDAVYDGNPCNDYGYGRYCFTHFMDTPCSVKVLADYLEENYPMDRFPRADGWTPAPTTPAGGPRAGA